jgi:heme exporter protein A
MLDVKNLTFGFGKKPLFSGLNFSLTEGELIRIDGHNGAGKSTLISIISGLQGGYQGDISYGIDGDFRVWTSWIAADANGLYPTLSAVSNLRFWLGVRGQIVTTKTIKEHLDSWGVTGEWLQSGLLVSKFSTGMKRRLALCRLQLEASKLWIIDEPLFGLDESACGKFKSLLQEHLDNGGAAILVTHDARILNDIRHQTIFLGGT